MFRATERELGPHDPSPVRKLKPITEYYSAAKEVLDALRFAYVPPHLKESLTTIIGTELLCYVKHEIK